MGKKKSHFILLQSKKKLILHAYKHNIAVNKNLAAMKRVLIILIALTLSEFTTFAQMRPRIGYNYATPNIGATLNAMRPLGELNINTTSGRNGGTGTFEDPYIVSTAEELAEIATRVNSGTEASGEIFPNGNPGYADQYFLLTKDIDLSDYTPWMPISIPGEKIFFGHFDGGNNTITHLTTDFSTNNSNQGLFSVIGANASISNLKIRDSSVTGEIYTGSFVGAAGENSQIINCHNYSDVNATYYYCGGIAGASWGAIVNCSNAGNITSNQDFIGGIVGDFYGTIMSCINTGNISGTTSTGGIVGYSANAEIAHNINAGNIFASSVFSGGVVGFVTNYDSENTSTELLNFGGCFGPNTKAVIGRLWTENGQPSHASNCYYDRQMTDKTGVAPGNDVEGVVEPRFTHELIGFNMTEDLGPTWTYGNEVYGWNFYEDNYPTPDSWVHYNETRFVAAAPARLRYVNESDYDRFNNVRDDFHIFNDFYGLTWESASSKVSFSESLAQLLETGRDTLIVSLGDARKEIFIEITDMLGIDQNNTAEFSIYPNPAKNYIYVCSDFGYNAMLYTTDGRLASRTRHEIGNTQPIDLSLLTSGIYFLHLIDDAGHHATQKIVIGK